MATADQIKMLIEAHVLKNDDRFKTLVLQLAAYEAKLGHTSFAREIREILNKSQNEDVKIIHFNKEISELIGITYSDQRIAELVVANDIKDRIKRILKEYQMREKLRKYHLSNRRKILLEGPPGTGKTMTASVISTEIGLPLCTIKMDKLMTKFMGETGVKLRGIFDAIKEKPAVYFFDEFDAIGMDRNKENDVGEIRRILNLFLQFIEQDDSESIIIAATNNSKQLDPALFRRFDDVIHYLLPDELQIPSLIINRLGQFSSNEIHSCMNDIVKAAESLSHAELSKACDDAIKAAIMSDKKTVQGELLLQMIKEKIGAYS
ncbi:AAA family ATPase [Paenibacillus aquistagni]|uniref:AAA family ATPase n=1 Tax=Paenibacillus aquistagni TaxID=1852522 RepID=UPI00145AD926|nr:ATP-binding protein [Paenibacillus aquistagni]NMM52277.1 ATP-binding protein [Paenibacillus aquistagni]